MPTINASLSYAIKYSLATRHLESAALLTKLSFQQEQNYRPELDQLQRSYVTSAVILSVAAMEGMINELTADIAEQNGRQVQNIGLDREIISQITSLVSVSDKSFNQLSILDKYQTILIMARKEVFDKGKNPYQNANDLVALRNALVHYNTSWQRVVPGTEDFEPDFIEKRLCNKFALNPNGGRGAFFPYACMISHSCAKWAVTSAQDFIINFYERMTLPIHLNGELLKTQ